jgi:LPS-assembly lipoprotein
VYETYSNNIMKKFVTSLLIAFLVSACGWHLRGSETKDGSSAYNAPLNLAITSTDDHGPLMNSLRQLLHTYNVTEVTSATAGAYKLELKDVVLDKRAAAVGSDALVNVYELILYVDYQIGSPDKVLTAPNTRGSVSRTYNFEVNQANYSEQEEALIMREMYRDLAQQLLRRLKVLSNKEKAPSTP